MRIDNLPFTITDWAAIVATERPGQTGTVTQRTLEDGNVRVRLVEYSPGYLADHWCTRGHVILVLEGELITELQDGRIFRLPAGFTYRVADGAEAHRSRTDVGAKLFIVD